MRGLRERGAAGRQAMWCPGGSTRFVQNTTDARGSGGGVGRGEPRWAEGRDADGGARTRRRGGREGGRPGAGKVAPEK